MASALKQEQLKSLSLEQQLNNLQMKCDEYEEIHAQKQKQDLFETMIVSIEGEIQDIEIHRREKWENEAGMLLSQYQEEHTEMQDKYIHQLCVLYRKALPQKPEIDELFLTHDPKIN
jgi:hypothetical protein